MGRHDSRDVRKIHVGRRAIEVSSPDKPFFAAAGLSKFDIVDYYRRVAGLMLPHVKGRPLNLQRAPAGLEGERWYQQERPEWFADWIDGVRLERRSGGAVNHIVCRREADIVYLAEQACVTLHAWLSLAADPEHPDRLVFDLDPPESGRFADVVFAARRVRDLLRELDVTGFLMSTGSRGLHVLVPLRPEAPFAEVRDTAARVSRLLAARHPDRLTVEHRKKKRRGCIFLDYLRNAYGQTTVAPYSVRLRPRAPIALPLDWEELGALDSAQRFTVKNAFRRLSRKSDPWAGWRRHAVQPSSLADALARLENGE